MADVRCPLREAALISRNEPAILSGVRDLLYSELDGLASVVAARLGALGLPAGARVALSLPPDWRQVALFLGVLRLGAVACPVHARLPPAAVRKQIERLRCRALIAPSDAAGEIGLPALDPDALLLPGGEPPAGWSERMPLDRPAVILFTSGSTAEPRAAVLTYGNLYYSARGANDNLSFRSRERWLVTLPLCHVGGIGIVFRALLGGGALAFPGPREPLALAVERRMATHLSLVSTQLLRLLEHPPAPAAMRRLRVVLLGGGEIVPALVARAHQAGFPVYASYGLTEMASQVTAVGPATPPDRQGTSGRVLRHRELRLAPDGEILVRGATRFAGYAGDGGLEPATDADGWFATGDLGSLDAEGYLTVLGRKDNLFISGGENIQPEEIEAALCGLEGVDQALVVPVEDAEFGWRPAAFVRGPGAEPARLAAALMEILPRYKLPVGWFAWPEGEDLPSAKASRARFRALAAEGHGRLA